MVQIRYIGETEKNEATKAISEDNLIVLKNEEMNSIEKSPTQETQEEEFNFTVEWMMGLLKKSCSSEVLRNPVVANLLLCIVLGIPTLVLFALYPQYVLEFIVDHAAVIQITSPLVRLLSKIWYALSFLPLGTLYKFAIAVLDIDSNIVVALIYQVISTVVEVVAFQYHRDYGKLPDIDELKKFKKKISEFRRSLDFKENDAADGESEKLKENAMTTSRKLLELYLIQNAWGVPDTPTTIYFATATNWSIWIFATATCASNFTIGLIKVAAWMIALRQVQATIKDNPEGGLSAYDLLLGIDDELSLLETLCILGVSFCGFAVCVYRVCKFLWMCCLRSKYQNWRSHDVHVALMVINGEIELAKTKKLSFVEFKRLSSPASRVDINN